MISVLLNKYNNSLIMQLHHLKGLELCLAQQANNNIIKRAGYLVGVVNKEAWLVN